VITTPDLIESLVARSEPVRRLRAPLVRAAAWLLFAGSILALMTAIKGVRQDCGLSLQQPGLAIEIAAALATGILAAVAAFIISLPDRSRRWLWLPVPALLVWMGSIGLGCLSAWVELPPGMDLGEESGCIAALVMTGVPLALTLLIALRHAAPLNPTPVAIAGGLAVAGITAAALPLFHNHDASVLVLIWNLGIAAVLTTAAGAFGRTMFSWVAPR
jgi:hypothetical protein